MSLCLGANVIINMATQSRIMSWSRSNPYSALIYLKSGDRQAKVLRFQILRSSQSLKGFGGQIVKMEFETLNDPGRQFFNKWVSVNGMEF